MDDLFDFVGVEVRAADDDRLFLPAGYRQAPAENEAEVSGIEPAAAYERFAVRRRVVAVPRSDDVAPDLEAPDVPLGQQPVLVIHDAYLDAGNGRAEVDEVDRLRIVAVGLLERPRERRL